MTGDRLRQAADALNQAVARRVEGGPATAFQATFSAAARGDEEAFAALWRELQPAVLRYLKVVAPEAAEDLAAETWLEVIRGLKGFDGDASAFRGWVFTIARHRAIHRLRRSTRQAAEPLSTGTPADKAASQDPTTSEGATLTLISALPRDQAEVVTLRVLGGLTVPEIARITGKRPGAVRVLTHRGLRRIAEQVSVIDTWVEQHPQPARRVEGGPATAFQATLSAAARGDEEAFAALWRELQPAVLRYLKVAAPEAAEDLAADTWVSVIRGLGRFRGDEQRFRGWVFTIARLRAVDWHRQASRQPTATLPVELLAGRAAPGDPAAEAVELQSIRATLALIAELPHDQAEVVALRVVGGLDIAEVARILGKRPGAVRVLTHRGLRRIAEQVGVAQRESRAGTKR
jgi:RNA polymerase sigma-70 factor (ECF subfamily)